MLTSLTFTSLDVMEIFSEKPILKIEMTTMALSRELNINVRANLLILSMCYVKKNMQPISAIVP